MIGERGIHLSSALAFRFPVAVLACLFGCNAPSDGALQGYVEGEYVYVASSLPETLKSLHISRGDQVKVDEPLFELDDTPQKAAVNETQRRLANAKSTWEDLKKGRRPSEIAAFRRDNCRQPRNHGSDLQVNSCSNVLNTHHAVAISTSTHRNPMSIATILDVGRDVPPPNESGRKVINLRPSLEGSLSWVESDCLWSRSFRSCEKRS